MDSKTLYVVGDKLRLVVNKFIHDLEAREFTVVVIKPDVDELYQLPTTPAHVIICISDSLMFPIVREIINRRKRCGLYLYFAGKFASGISVADNEFVNQTPGVHFPSLPLNMDALAAAIESNSRERKLVLVVDDEPILLRTIKGWLDDEFEVTIVNSGEMALHFLQRGTTDLVLLDYKMPEMDGPTVLWHIRTEKRTKALPVMFLTAAADRESVLNVVKLKPNGYILKTKSPEEIKAAVRSFFSERVIECE